MNTNLRNMTAIYITNQQNQKMLMLYRRIVQRHNPTQDDMIFAQLTEF